MVEDLLGVGLADVNDGETIEVKIEDLRGSQDPRPAGRLVEGRPGGGPVD